jgi:hypothetical protein
MDGGANIQARQKAQVVWGSLLLVLGILLFGQQIGLWESWSFGRVWPIMLVALGARRLFTSAAGGRRLRGTLLMALGVVLLLYTTVPLLLQQSWPLLIVICGILMLLKAFTGRVGCAGLRTRHAK